MYGDIFQEMGPSVVCLSAHWLKHLECLVGVGGSSQALIPAGLKQHSSLSASVTIAVAACHSTALVALRLPGHLALPRCDPTAPTPLEVPAGAARCVAGARLAFILLATLPGSGTNSPLNTGLSGTGRERIGGLSSRRWRYARGGAAAG